MIENKDATSVYRRGLAGESLDEDEAMQFFLFGKAWLEPKFVAVVEEMRKQDHPTHDILNPI